MREYSQVGLVAASLPYLALLGWNSSLLWKSTLMRGSIVYFSYLNIPLAILLVVGFLWAWRVREKMPFLFACITPFSAFFAAFHLVNGLYARFYEHVFSFAMGEGLVAYDFDPDRDLELNSFVLVAYLTLAAINYAIRSWPVAERLALAATYLFLYSVTLSVYYFVYLGGDTSYVVERFQLFLWVSVWTTLASLWMMAKAKKCHWLISAIQLVITFLLVSYCVSNPSASMSFRDRLTIFCKYFLLYSGVPVTYMLEGARTLIGPRLRPRWQGGRVG